MRCKKHPPDLSSSVGVCASCLRERLSILIAAQAQAQAQSQTQQQQHLDDQFRRTRKQQDPPPLVFPRSVSPYVSRRKSDHAISHNRNYLFYSTPQVGPTFTTTTSTSTSKKKSSKLSILSNLFRPRSDKFNSDPILPYRDSCESSSSSSSSSWFLSAMFRTRRKKQSSSSLFEDSTTTAGGRRDCRVTNRGMSPVRGADSDEECDRSPSGSGDSTEEWRRTPLTVPAAVRRTRAGQSRNVSGLAFCLSPLVRASPNRHWNQKAGLPPDIGFSGEIRAPMKPHLSTAASFCANRSRKLADFGRVNQNR